MSSASSASEEKKAPVKWTRNPWIWAALAGLLLIPLLRPLTRRVPPPPPTLGSVGDFSLVDSRGEAVSARGLRGEPVVMFLFYTRCGEFCAATTKRARELKARLANEGLDVSVLGMSVDPTHDTPERLAAFARGANASGVRLLTGAESEVEGLVAKGFRAGLGLSMEGPASRLSAFLVLIDGEGQIRGYYDATEEGIDELFHRTRHVLRGDAG